MLRKSSLGLIAGLGLAVAASAFDPAADYEVSYEDYGLALIKSGTELLAGLAVKIPEPAASLLVKYRRVR